jgi:hypothetical protein
MNAAALDGAYPLRSTKEMVQRCGAERPDGADRNTGGTATSMRSWHSLFEILFGQNGLLRSIWTRRSGPHLRLCSRLVDHTICGAFDLL